MITAVFVSALFALANASPRFRYDPWDYGTYSGVSSYAGPSGAYAGPGGAYAGAGAGAGFPFYSGFPFFPGFPFNFPFNFPPMYFGNWYEGPDVCKSEKVEDDKDDFAELRKDPEYHSSRGDHESERCESTNTKAVCVKYVTGSDGITKKHIITYKCCYGFMRHPNGGPGCVENPDEPLLENAPASTESVKMSDKSKYSFAPSPKVDLKNLLPTLRDMGAVRFVEASEDVGLIEALHSKNFTIFCPTNSAFQTYQEQQNKQDNEISTSLVDTKLNKRMDLLKMMTSHIMSGFLGEDDLENNQVLQTENPNARIRANIYYTPEKITTVNCVPLAFDNRFARNGIVHTIGKIMNFPTKTVADIIAGDVQFSVLKRMLSEAGLVQTLRNPSGTFTIFAPTDSAFRAAQDSHKSGSTCGISIMKHHILDHIICSSAIPDQARSVNLVGELLTLRRDEHHKLYVDDVQVVAKDLVATNGVVHVVDGLLSAKQAKSISQTLKDTGLKEFLALLESANLKDEFDSMENATFFVPTNEAIKKSSSLKVLNNLNNTEVLRNVLRYHAVHNEVEIRRIKSEKSFQSKLENTTIHIQVYLSKRSHVIRESVIQCAPIVSQDNKLCRSTMHVINRVLFPPRPTLVDILENTEGFSTIVLLLRATGLETRLRSALGSRETFSLLAPTDDAFHRMGERNLFQLFEDIFLARDLIRMHILPGTVCCSQLMNNLMSGRPQVRALDGSLLNLQVSFDGSLLIAGARIVDCEIMSNNGLVHVVDAVLGHEYTRVMQPRYDDNVFISF